MCVHINAYMHTVHVCVCVFTSECVDIPRHMTICTSI